MKCSCGVELFDCDVVLTDCSEVVYYTGITTDQLTGVTRGEMGTTAASHSDGDAVHSTILFLSDTAEGSAVSWTVQPWDTSMFANEDGLYRSYD